MLKLIITALLATSCVHILPAKVLCYNSDQREAILKFLDEMHLEHHEFTTVEQLREHYKEWPPLEFPLF